MILGKGESSERPDEVCSDRSALAPHRTRGGDEGAQRVPPHPQGRQQACRPGSQPASQEGEDEEASHRPRSSQDREEGARAQEAEHDVARHAQGSVQAHEEVLGRSPQGEGHRKVLASSRHAPVLRKRHRGFIISIFLRAYTNKQKLLNK